MTRAQLLQRATAIQAKGCAAAHTPSEDAIVSMAISALAWGGLGFTRAKYDNAWRRISSHHRKLARWARYRRRKAYRITHCIPPERYRKHP